MADRGRGVAYELWLRVEQERARQGLTKLDLWRRMKSALGDGPSPARTTIDNLRDSTRAPSPRIVNALADALGIDRGEAAQLAGIVPPATSAEVDVRDSIRRSATYTDEEKRALLALLDVFDAAKGQAPAADRTA
jgi:hypothetical protein